MINVEGVASHRRFGELLEGFLLRAEAYGGAELFVGYEASEYLSEVRHIVNMEQKAIDAVIDLEVGALAIGSHGNASCHHRLDNGQWKAFLARWQRHYVSQLVYWIWVAKLYVCKHRSRQAGFLDFAIKPSLRLFVARFVAAYKYDVDSLLQRWGQGCNSFE